LRSKGYGIETIKGKDKYGLAYHRLKSVGQLFKFNLNQLSYVRAMPFAILEESARFSLAFRLDEPFFNAGDPKDGVERLQLSFCDRTHASSSRESLPSPA
jgi:hypothetical protein